MNKVFLIGNLTKDPEIKVTQSGKEMAKFSLAVSSSYEKGDDGKYKTDFFNCIAWGKTCELMNKYTQKGSKLLVEGNISNNTWDKPDGTKGYSVNINVSTVEFLSPKSEKDTSSSSSYNSNSNSSDYSPEGKGANDGGEIDLDDINISMPF